VFNMVNGVQRGEIFIYYHYKEGKITSRMETYKRNVLITSSKGGDLNDKDAVESKE